MPPNPYEVKELGNTDSGTGGNQEPAYERRLRIGKQVSYVVIVTLSFITLGSVLTWPSPGLSSLGLDNSTLVGTEIVLTESEKDLTGSLVYLGSLCGGWIIACVAARVGRRRSLQLLVAPFVLGWVVTGLAANSSLLLTGRFFLGMGVGSASVIGYAYVVELSDTCIRGMMATMPTLGVVVGSLYTVALGYALPWHYLSLVATTIPLIFLFTTFLLPESPSYLVVTGRRQQAIALLQELRGEYEDVHAEVTELERINAASSGGWKGLLEKEMLHRIGLVVMIFFFSQMSGNFVIMINTTRILQATGASVDADAITVIIGVLRVFATIGAIFLLDVLGRRYCLLISHAINATFLFVLATFLYMVEAAEPDDDTFSDLMWVPVLCVVGSLLFCDIGVHPIQFIVASEYFPTNVRAQGSSVCNSIGTVIIFTVLQLYSPMLAALGQPGLYWFYGSMSVCGVFFAFFFVIETKGVNVG